ncbi:BCCT family transporter [uncultured Phenylobacterium sp.]|uniref:BCCT family transporter n=1 Tax=uncultured Phenylobacterium sp. TaxID=349273 RepID=UPI0025F26872|nr:BCCT family transporter [uncultured Phenylobacterium sp.]
MLSAAIVVTLLTAAAIVVGWGGRRVAGPQPLSLPGFMALLFTSGLDVGLVMLPLTEFPVYAREPTYAFANPLAIAFGSWGFLVWGFYFLTTFYFVALEPRLRLFAIPAVKAVNNLVIIGTCAFTAHLLFLNLPFYAPVLGGAMQYFVVAVTILLSVLTSTHIRYIRVLSVGSMWTFAALVAAMWWRSEMGIAGLAASAADLGEYFRHLPRFVLPMSDYHAFYLFWWYSWSIMIGQFVARFVGGMPTWQLAAAMLVMPSIPIAAWFSVLYFYFRQQLVVPPALSAAMIAVGVLFVVNSLDSLIRLYSDNLNLTTRRLGTPAYVASHWLLMCVLVLAFQLTPLRIEWIGLVVIGLYAAIYGLLVQHRGRLTTPLSWPERSRRQSCPGQS